MEINGFDITPQNGDAGINIPISISVTSDNEDLDRSIKIVATCGDKEALLSLTQLGKREEYITTENATYLTSDGEIYGVIKEEYYES